MKHKWTVLANNKEQLNKIHKDMQKVTEEAKEVKESAKSIIDICKGLNGMNEERVSRNVKKIEVLMTDSNIEEFTNADYYVQDGILTVFREESFSEYGRYYNKFHTYIMMQYVQMISVKD